MITVAIANKKGGVGKSTTSYSLATGLKKRDFKVLAIDLDSQCNLTKIAGLNQDGPTSFGVIAREVKIADAIVKMKYLDIIPASKALVNAEQALPEGVNRLMRIREALDDIESEYDFCILDNAPAVDVITVNSMMASDYLIIPAESNELSSDGIVEVYESFLDVKKYVNPNIKIAGILLTRYKPNTVIGREYSKVFAEVAKNMDSKVFSVVIRENVSLSELPSIHMPIYDYKPESNGAKDYNAFVDEFLASIQYE